ALILAKSWQRKSWKTIHAKYHSSLNQSLKSHWCHNLDFLDVRHRHHYEWMSKMEIVNGEGTNGSPALPSSPSLPPQSKISIVSTQASRTVDHFVPLESQQPLNANVSEQVSQVTSVAIPPDELYSFVFASLDEEMTVDASYLFAIIIEFIRSANLEKIKLHPNIYVLAVRLLARNERYAELGLCIMNKVIKPSKVVALQLLESGRHNVKTRKLGMHTTTK
nr:regulator of MON1-CCZ1 complex isoform X1 [Tanacetum cinerariifolium]